MISQKKSEELLTLEEADYLTYFLRDNNWINDTVISSGIDDLRYMWDWSDVEEFVAFGKF